ncbi:MAG: segregation/condensation protein A [Alphaproteobacteria bacterium]|nr:segregation/condensation protein A [Alphaproteobacteria bacterium SS10]
MSATFEADIPTETPANDGPGGAAPRGEQLVLDLDGFEGPIDLMLTLARDRKLDIARMSMVALADQYLNFIQEAQALRLELAADYLVMAAWLTYLKSRLLLPPEEEEGGEEPTGEELAAALAFQLKRLEAMQKAAQALNERPRLGYGRMARGAPEGLNIVTTASYDLSLHELLTAYGGIQRRQQHQVYKPKMAKLYSVEEALSRLKQSLGAAPGWVTLQSLLPSLGAETNTGGLSRRSAIASTFLASLELAKHGNVEIRQEAPFAPVHLRWTNEQAAETASQE